MNKDFELIEAIRVAIENEMAEYSGKLQQELMEECMTEFERRMDDHRRKVVLDVCEKLEILSMYEPSTMKPQIQIRLN